MRGCYALITDISDRKLIEQALQQSEARFQKLAAASPAVIYTGIEGCDGISRFEYISPAAAAIHELPITEIVQNGALVSEQIHPEDRAGYLQALSYSLKTLQPFRYEWRIITPSGKIKWLQANSRPEPRVHGEVAWHGIVMDISDRKQAEAALRQSEERFRRAFDDAAIGMALVALDCKIFKVNRAFCQIMGFAETELLQQSFQTITHPDDLNSCLSYVEELLSGQEHSFQIEKRYIHKQGRVIWANLSASLIRNQEGIPLYLVCQVQDISDRHSAERVKDEFISVVSHELRTPLTAIRGALGLLHSGKLAQQPDKFNHILQMAVNNSDRLSRLINTILDLERLESGRVELMREQCDARDLIHQAIEAVQPLADQASITLQVVPIAVNFLANPGAIVQVLINLLSNALKFSPPHTTIRLEARSVEATSIPATPAPPSIGSRPPLLYLLFSVQDQGRGIPPEKLETIFGRFQQVDASDSRQKGGTGLGLAICKSIVEQHRGQIWVESVLGAGSRFYFTLPLSEKGL